MRRLVGPAVMGLGLLDILYVCVALSEPLADIGGGGLFDAVGPYLDREVAFWHLMFGVLILNLGGLVHWIQARTGTLPAFPGWTLLGMSLVGVVVMPNSGFWVGLVLGILMLRVARQGRVRPAPSAPSSGTDPAHGRVSS